MSRGNPEMQPGGWLGAGGWRPGASQGASRAGGWGLAARTWLGLRARGGLGRGGWGLGRVRGPGGRGWGLGAGTRLRHTRDTRERFANACERLRTLRGRFANALATIPGQRLDPWTPTFKTGTLLLRIREKDPTRDPPFKKRTLQGTPVQRSTRNVLKPAGLRFREEGVRRFIGSSSKVPS